jgi:hypothetical protein
VTLPAIPYSGRDEGPHVSTGQSPFGHHPEQDLQTHVRCRICHRWYKAITYTHLRYKHGIENPSSYKDEYSLTKITAAEVRGRIARQKFLVDRHAIDYIRRNWGKLSLKDITRYLGIDASTVRAHALRMRLGLLVEQWNEAKVIKALRRAHQSGVPLSSGEARKRIGPLYKAAVNWFGSWKKALAATGIRYDKVARRGPFESWSEGRIFREARALAKIGKERDYLYLQKHHSKLYAAARNHFGSWMEMLRAAELVQKL